MDTEKTLALGTIIFFLTIVIFFSVYCIHRNYLISKEPTCEGKVLLSTMDAADKINVIRACRGQ